MTSLHLLQTANSDALPNNDDSLVVPRQQKDLNVVIIIGVRHAIPDDVDPQDHVHQSLKDFVVGLSILQSRLNLC